MNSLYSAKDDLQYKITEMPEIPLLHTLGVFTGGIVKKMNTYALGGPVLLLIDRREVAVGKEFALKIMVEEEKS